MKLISTTLLLICFITTANSQNTEPFFFICGQTEAQYPGGLTALQKHYCRVINRAYKKIEAKHPVEGQAIITFKIDTTGGVKVDRFRKSIRADVDSILVRAIISSNRWIPATQGGNKIVSYKTQKFTFCASDESCAKSGGFVCR